MPGGDLRDDRPLGWNRLPLSPPRPATETPHGSRNDDNVSEAPSTPEAFNYDSEDLGVRDMEIDEQSDHSIGSPTGSPAEGGIGGLAQRADTRRSPSPTHTDAQKGAPPMESSTSTTTVTFGTLRSGMADLQVQRSPHEPRAVQWATTIAMAGPATTSGETTLPPATSKPLRDESVELPCNDVAGGASFERSVASVAVEDTEVLVERSSITFEVDDTDIVEEAAVSARASEHLHTFGGPPERLTPAAAGEQRRAGDGTMVDKGKCVGPRGGRTACPDSANAVKYNRCYRCRSIEAGGGPVVDKGVGIREATGEQRKAGDGTMVDRGKCVGPKGGRSACPDSADAVKYNRCNRCRPIEKCIGPSSSQTGCPDHAHAVRYQRCNRCLLVSMTQPSSSDPFNEPCLAPRKEPPEPSAEIEKDSEIATDADVFEIEVEDDDDDAMLVVPSMEDSVEAPAHTMPIAVVTEASQGHETRAVDSSVTQNHSLGLETSNAPPTRCQWIGQSGLDGVSIGSPLVVTNSSANGDSMRSAPTENVSKPPFAQAPTQSSPCSTPLIYSKPKEAGPPGHVWDFARGQWIDLASLGSTPIIRPAAVLPPTYSTTPPPQSSIPQQTAPPPPKRNVPPTFLTEIDVAAWQEYAQTVGTFRADGTAITFWDVARQIVQEKGDTEHRSDDASGFAVATTHEFLVRHHKDLYGKQPASGDDKELIPDHAIEKLFSTERVSQKAFTRTCCRVEVEEWLNQQRPSTTPMVLSQKQLDTVWKRTLDLCPWLKPDTKASAAEKRKQLACGADADTLERFFCDIEEKYAVVPPERRAERLLIYDERKMSNLTEKPHILRSKNALVLQPRTDDGGPVQLNSGVQYSFGTLVHGRRPHGGEEELCLVQCCQIVPPSQDDDADDDEIFVDALHLTKEDVSTGVSSYTTTHGTATSRQFANTMDEWLHQKRDELAAAGLDPRNDDGSWTYPLFLHLDATPAHGVRHGGSSISDYNILRIFQNWHVIPILYPFGAGIQVDAVELGVNQFLDLQWQSANAALDRIDVCPSLQLRLPTETDLLANIHRQRAVPRLWFSQYGNSHIENQPTVRRQGLGSSPRMTRRYVTTALMKYRVSVVNSVVQDALARAGLDVSSGLLTLRSDTVLQRCKPGNKRAKVVVSTPNVPRPTPVDPDVLAVQRAQAALNNALRNQGKRETWKACLLKAVGLLKTTAVIKDYVDAPDDERTEENTLEADSTSQPSTKEAEEPIEVSSAQVVIDEDASEGATENSTVPETESPSPNKLQAVPTDITETPTSPTTQDNTAMDVEDQRLSAPADAGEAVVTEESSVARLESRSHEKDASYATGDSPPAPVLLVSPEAKPSSTDVVPERSSPAENAPQVLAIDDESSVPKQPRFLHDDTPSSMVNPSPSIVPLASPPGKCDAPEVDAVSVSNATTQDAALEQVSASTKRASSLDRAATSPKGTRKRPLEAEKRRHEDMCLPRRTRAVARVETINSLSPSSAVKMRRRKAAANAVVEMNTSSARRSHKRRKSDR